MKVNIDRYKNKYFSNFHNKSNKKFQLKEKINIKEFYEKLKYNHNLRIIENTII